MNKLVVGTRAEEWVETESLLLALEAASPNRLAGKRKEFRALTSLERYGDLLSELKVAAWLASHNVAFEFGQPGQPQPDLVLPAFGFGIEVTRRARTPDRDLRRAISRGIARALPRGAMTGPRYRLERDRIRPIARVDGFPIAMRERVLDAIAEEVARAIGQGDRYVDAVARPAIGQYPAVVARIDLRGGTLHAPQVVHDARWVDLTIPMLDIEDLVRACLEEHRKAMQGAAMPAILLVDVTRLSHLLWLRSPGTWADRLGLLLKPEHAYLGVAVAALVDEPRLGLGVGERASDVVRRSLVRWAAEMGMSATTTAGPNPFHRQQHPDA